MALRWHESDDSIGMGDAKFQDFRRWAAAWAVAWFLAVGQILVCQDNEESAVEGASIV
jgi:hypothetical protein